MFRNKRKSRSFKQRKPIYSSSTPQNRRKKRSTVRKTNYLKITVIALFLVALTYYIFFSNNFIIKEIVFTNSNLESEHIEKSIHDNLEQLLGRNMLFTSIYDINTSLSSQFPNLQQIQIKKNYPDQLEVTFIRYEYAANVVSESKSMKTNFIVNQAGYVAKQQHKDPTLPTFKIISEEPLNLNSQIIDPELLAQILETAQNYEDRFGMKIIETQYLKIPREIHLITEKEFEIWLDAQKSIDEQFKKLKKALVKLDIWETPLEYIDLRIFSSNGGKIIYNPL